MGKTTSKSLIDTLGLPADLLNQMFEFIAVQFKKMPKIVQVIVYFVILGLFALAVLKLTLGDRLFPPGELQIRGEIALMGGEAIPDTLWPLELGGEDLYVSKVSRGAAFVYEWILTIPRSELNFQESMVFSKYNPVVRQSLDIGLTKPIYRSFLNQLAAGSADGKAHLAVDVVTFKIEVDTALHKVPKDTQGLVDLLDLAAPRAFAGQVVRRQELPSDTARLLIRKFSESRNPAAQYSFSGRLATGGSEVMAGVAESLRVMVLGRRDGDISNYALLLARFDSLALLTSSGRYSDRFGGTFYQETVSLLLNGDEFEQRNLASLLRRLQDARTIEPILAGYLSSASNTSRRLCLYVLESFETNSDPSLKQYLAGRLRQLSQQETSSGLKAEIDDTASRLAGG